MSDKERKEARHLQDFLLDQIMNMTDAELLAEVQADGLDLEHEAEAMRDDIARAAGKARMREAQAELRHRAASARLSADKVSMIANDDIALARRLTKAARNGTGQSEDDVRSTARDLQDIAAFQQSQGESKE